MTNKLAGEDLSRWTAKNAQENENHILKPGDTLIDSEKRRGRVTSVNIPNTPTTYNHGTITVQRDDGEEARYVAHGWQGRFRIDRP